MSNCKVQLENLKKIKKKDLIDYYNEKYVPEKTIYFIVGNINKSNIIKTLTKLLPSNKKLQCCNKEVPCFSNSLESNILFDKWKYSKIADSKIIYKTKDIISFKDKIKLHFALNCLQYVLFQKLRYQNKSIYFLNCHYNTSLCGTIIEISYNCSLDKLKKSYNSILKTIDKYKNIYFSKKIINSCRKLYLIGYLNKNDKNVKEITKFFINQYLLDKTKLINKAEVKKIILKTTKEDIQNILRQYFNNNIFAYQSNKQM